MTTGKSIISVEPGALDGAKRYYATAADAASLPTATYGTAITVADWTPQATRWSVLSKSMLPTNRSLSEPTSCT